MLEDKRQLREFSLTFGASVRQHTVMKLQYEVLFATRDVVAVKHARRREQFSFFLAVVTKDLLVKSTSATELEFAEETVDFLWFDNSNSAYRDNKNSPYSIIDNVDMNGAPTTLVLHCTSFHEAKCTASNRIYREDQIMTLNVIMIPHLKKKRIDLRANVTVPGPVERQHH